MWQVASIVHLDALLDCNSVLMLVFCDCSTHPSQNQSHFVLNARSKVLIEHRLKQIMNNQFMHLHMGLISFVVKATAMHFL